ncbi:MAG: ArsC family transcriptional regulator [Chlorobi bacterium]|nr:ArsC family transcriptional regulator [Chlorobiota bacterium]
MASIIQIFGTKKCKDTAKAQRFFKERSIKIQFVDLNEKAISKGELNSIARSIPMEDLIDTAGKEYEKKNLKFVIHDIEEKLLEFPLLFRTPITRFGQKAAVGHTPDLWKEWAKESK